MEEGTETRGWSIGASVLVLLLICTGSCSQGYGGVVMMTDCPHLDPRFAPH